MLDPITPQAPFIVPIEAQQNSTLSFNVQFCNPDANGNPDPTNPINLTGYTFVGSVWPDQASRSAAIVAITVTVTAATTGWVNVAVTAAAMAISQGEFYYDIAGKVGTADPQYFMAGTFKVTSRKSHF